jgi:hypothetical protein
MPDSITTPLIVDFLDWLAKAPRPYAEVMETWRTSCPRLTVWEDAMDLGYVVRRREGSGEPVVGLTPLGERLLEQAATRPLATA